ncbi:class D beta-lactamase [Phormidium tenue FACHB-886]|nr:class D beta-lactamase [Phormidium tenue FACHB-886]
MPIGCGLLLCSLIGLAGLPVSSQPVQANAGLSMSRNPNELTIAQQVDDQQINLGQSFQALGVDGSIVIYDKNNDRFYEHNPSRNTTAFFPASTFKIFNALVSLETGVIPNDVAVLTWDGIKRELPGVGEIPAWNRDTNLRQAFKDSTIWFYQVLARKNGHERMQQFINQAGYGNRQIGTEQQIDRFWLDGPLQITPKQHIEFLERLDRNDLPFSERTLALVKDIMLVEQTPNYTLRGKTGWDTSVTPNIGWFVGYLEQNNNKYFFATNIMMPSAEDAAKRLEVTRRSFKALGLL